MHDVCGVILAGGKSRRMGRDKAMLPWRVGTFVQTIEDSMKGLLAEILVIRRQDDMRKDCGPLGGIETGLLLCRAPWALFVSCDTPLLDQSIYRRFIEAETGSAKRASSPTHGRFWGNFPLMLHKDHLPVVQRLLDGGERSVRALLKEIRCQKIYLNEAEAQQIHSINTPQDYEALLRSEHVLAC